MTQRHARPRRPLTRTPTRRVVDPSATFTSRLRCATTTGASSCRCLTSASSAAHDTDPCSRRAAQIWHLGGGVASRPAPRRGPRPENWCGVLWEFAKLRAGGPRGAGSQRGLHQGDGGRRHCLCRKPLLCAAAGGQSHHRHCRRWQSFRCATLTAVSILTPMRGHRMTHRCTLRDALACACVLHPLTCS